MNYQLSPSVHYDIVDDEVLLINFDEGSYYIMNAAMTAIFEALVNGTSREQVIEKLENLSGFTLPFVKEIDDQLLYLEQEGILSVASESSEQIADLVFPESANWTLQIDKHEDMAELLKNDPIHDVDRTMGWPKLEQ